MQILRAIYFTVRGVQAAKDLKEGNQQWMQPGESSTSIMLEILASGIVVILVSGALLYFGVKLFLICLE